MAGQGEMLITMDVPESTPRGTLISGAGTLSATLKAVGVIVEGSDAGETKANVQVGGTALVLCGATLTAGALVVADAAGEAIVFTEDTDAVNGNNHLVCGIMLEGGADQELRSMLIR